MKVKLEDLKAAFAVCDGVTMNPVLESSQYCRIRQEGGRLALSMSGSMRADASVAGQSAGGKWTAYADRRLVKAFLASCSGADVELYWKDRLTIKAEQRLELALRAPVTGYESWTPPKSAAALTDGARVALRAAAAYMPTDVAGCESMECVGLFRDWIAATDSVAVAAFGGAYDGRDVVVPADAARFIAGNACKVAADADGVGCVVGAGSVYQPRDVRLTDFPWDRPPGRCLKELIAAALKERASLTLRASDLLGVLRVASGFMFDKSDACSMEAAKGVLTVTATMASGTFKRGVLAKGGDLAPFGFAARRLLPWLEHAGDRTVELAKRQDAVTLRWADGKLRGVLIVADS